MNSSEQSKKSTSVHDECQVTDYDQEYRFGRTPRVIAPFPFTTQEFARLLVLRSRVHADLFGSDDVAAE